MESSNKKIIPYLLGGASALCILARLFQTVLASRYFYSTGFFWFYWILVLIGCGMVAAAAFMDRKDFIAPAGFGVLALVFVISFFRALHFSTFIAILAMLASAAVLLVMFTELAPSMKELCAKIWFVPVILAVLFILADVIGSHGLYVYDPYMLWYYLQNMMLVAMTALAGLWAAQSYDPAKTAPVAGKAGFGGAAPAGVARTADGTPQPEGFYPLTTHILLLLLTCGIWYYIWIYRTTEYLNCAPDEAPRNATTELLLCLFVPFYAIFWVYKSAQRIDKLAAANGVQSDLTTLCLILAIFIGIVPPILMQDKINAITGAAPAVGANPARAAAQPQPQTQYAAPQPAPVQSEPAPQTPASVPEQLAQYKQLLDSGAITQEEYDALKQRLLSL